MMVKTIRFETGIYPKKAVDTAIEDFGDIFKAYSREKEEEIIVCIDTDDESIKNEFCNYVLGIAKKIR